jgi:hypothetical protein
MAAETGARAVAASLAKSLELASHMDRVSHQLSGKPAPLPVGRFGVERRLACRLAAVMSSVPNHRQRFGPIEWRAGHYTAADSWHDAEAALLERHVLPLPRKE